MDVGRLIDKVFWSIFRSMMKRMKPETLVICKYCGSGDVVKYGTYHGSQRWWCKDCKRKFVDSDTLPKMKTPITQIASALSGYYGGMSLDSICRHLEQQYSNSFTDAGIYNWVIRFTKDAVDRADKHTPTVGKVWVADETVLKIGGKNIWFWDIIDAKTRFLLSSHISRTRTIKDARKLMEKASQRAGGMKPDLILTDKLAAYLDGIELTFGADTKHIPIKGITAMLNTNLIERFHGTLKDRIKVMRGFHNVDTARLILDGWLVHYNYFKPHESLKGRAPAEVAGIKDSDKNWMDVVRSEVPIIQQDDDDSERPTGQYTQRPKDTKKKRPKRTKSSKVRQKPATTLTTVRM